MERPPSPRTTTTASPRPATAGGDERVLVTTSQLVATVEDELGCRLDEGAVEELLLELDRDDYVEWATLASDGDHVWDVTETPERVAEAVADALVARVQSWLRG